MAEPKRKGESVYAFRNRQIAEKKKESRIMMLWAAGVIGLPIVLMVACTLRFSEPDGQTEAQARCAQRGITCEEDGSPLGTSR